MSPAPPRVTTAELRLIICVALLVSMSGVTPRAQGPDRIRHSRLAAKGRYIVRLRANADPEAFGVALEQVGRGHVRRIYRHALTGIALQTTEAQAQALAADPAVASVSDDARVWGAVESQPIGDLDNWGLDRIDQRASLGSGPYDHLYRYSAEGLGVHVYVIDTGIRTTHVEFSGRASVAFDALPEDPPGDCNGHGTHVAGIAAGARFGLAKRATVHAVRVIGCDNAGYLSDVIAGIDWVTANRELPAVINMSIESVANEDFNVAARAAIASGITFVAAAGNDAADACSSLVGGVPELIVVAASDASDSRASFSNGGKCVDIFAPGDFIRSAYADSDTSETFLSGTSMASPHVAGAAALYLQDAPHASPLDVAAELTATATRAVIRDPLAAPDRLLFTPHLGDRTPPTVSIVNPARGALVHGRQQVRVLAEDDVELSSVTVRACGAMLSHASGAISEFEWNTARASNGSCAIEAQARDLAGNVARATRSVTVRNPTQSSVPMLTLTPAQRQLWPPNGKLVPVTLRGTVSDARVNRVAFSTQDEYGRIQPSGTVAVVAGRFAITVPLQASRRGSDHDGRRYTITVTAATAGGQRGASTAIIIVGHNRGR